MSNLTTRCQGWSNPSTTFYGPVIISLSSYYSPAGLTSLVTIYGENFYSYSTVLFATYNPTVYFISSNALQFYVPSSLFPGTYPVQVFNGSLGSNIVTYNLDNSSGYWILQPNNSITNTNSGGIEVDDAIIGTLEVTQDATFNQNIILNNINQYPSPLSSYIQFSDGSQQFTAFNVIIGEIKMYAGLILPPNYLWCDGSPLYIGNYTDLFNVIGFTYGGGGNFFNLPNLLQKFPIGSKDTSNMSVNYTDATGTVNTLSTGGNQTMESNQLGKHTHSFAPTGSINLSMNSANGAVPTFFVTEVNADINKQVPDTADQYCVTGIHNHSESIIVTNNMSGTVGDNNYTNKQEDLLQPFTVIQYIICYR